jgi:hypothetical protein
MVITVTTQGNLEQKIVQSVRSLPSHQQEAVLEFVLSLHTNERSLPPVTQSLRDIAKLPLAERQKVIAPYLSAMAEDFCNDPALTEFSVLDCEDWDD